MFHFFIKSQVISDVAESTVYSDVELGFGEICICGSRVEQSSHSEHRLVEAEVCHQEISQVILQEDEDPAQGESS